MTAVAGETLRLKCPVAGYPIEEIRWERGNRELPDDLRQKVLRDGTLMISSVQKHGDAGVYTCWARNKQGHSARRSGDVAVIGKAYHFRFPTITNCRRWTIPTKDESGNGCHRKTEGDSRGREDKFGHYRMINQKTRNKDERVTRIEGADRNNF